MAPQGLTISKAGGCQQMDLQTLADALFHVFLLYLDSGSYTYTHSQTDSSAGALAL
jgi:hypothetical protein